jgi:hypothetical protein
VALAVLVTGGSAGAVVLVRHLNAQHSKRETAAPIAATSTSPVSSAPESDPASSSAPPSPTAPPSPPGQVTIAGMTIGISAVNTDPDATAVATTLAAYFGGINSRNFPDAWDTYTSGEQAAVPYSAFASSHRTSQDNPVTVQSIRDDGGGNLEADVSFRSHQAGQYGPHPGETCTNWTLDYHLVGASGATAGSVQLSYLIDKVTLLGPGDTAC